MRVQWSRNRRRHVTPKSQGRDPDIFEPWYLKNRARQTVGYSGGARILEQVGLAAWPKVVGPQTIWVNYYNITLYKGLWGAGLK